MRHLSLYARYGLVAAFLALFVAFSLASPTFLTLANLKSLVINHFALLSLVSLGMTLVVAAGGSICRSALRSTWRASATSRFWRMAARRR